MAALIHFILNNQEIVAEERAGTLVLDYLRRKQRLVGTKEGCKEGDCGACMVLLGELCGKQMRYTPMTSCLIPLGEVHGKHLVTVEGLNMQTLSPVQQAIVDEGGSQCGFCTPGIVVSLTGYLMTNDIEISDNGIKVALGGNLCRCTGYTSLKRAGHKLVKRFGNGRGNGKTPASSSIETLIDAGALPEYFRSIPARLKKLPKSEPDNDRKTDVFIAGGTDLYVQHGDNLPDARVVVLNLHPEMKGITIRDDHVHVGALTTFEEWAEHPEILRLIPNMKAYMHLNASWQIRNRATLGGNIVNASPIGDMTILLLALDSQLVLTSDGSQRKVPMRTFYRGYKKMDMRPSEILTEIIFPRPTRGSQIHFEKVSKRRTLDIASVNSAINIRADKDTIASVSMTMGGVAPVPLFMAATCEKLTGRHINKDTILDAIAVANGEISPLSDIRGSAEYKRLLVRQLIIAHFTKLFPEYLTLREFYETS